MYYSPLLYVFFCIQIAREEWSGTLWANLDIEQLTEGIEEFLKCMRKFPKEVKALPICQVLEERMKEFKNSIPLFADLKNEALRDRFDVYYACVCISLFHQN